MSEPAPPSPSDSPPRAILRLTRGATYLLLAAIALLGVIVPAGLVGQITELPGWRDQADHFARVEARFASVREELMRMSPRPRLGYLAGPVNWQDDSWQVGFFHTQFVLAPIPMTFEANQRLILANYPGDDALDAALKEGGYRVINRFGQGVALIEPSTIAAPTTRTATEPAP